MLNKDLTNANFVQIDRRTSETELQLRLRLTGEGQFSGSTGIGFFDHMLNILSFYSRMDLGLQMTGDLSVDQHHSLEDLGLCLGTALRRSLAEEGQICRKRYASVYLPMDEALLRVVLDLSGRPYLMLKLPTLKERVGGYETETLPEFLRAFVHAAQITLHAEGLYGSNSHHLIEALFKGLGLCLREAVKPDAGGAALGPNSTKGLLDGFSAKEDL